MGTQWFRSNPLSEGIIAHAQFRGGPWKTLLPSTRRSCGGRLAVAGRFSRLPVLGVTRFTNSQTAMTPLSGALERSKRHKEEQSQSAAAIPNATASTDRLAQPSRCRAQGYPIP